MMKIKEERYLYFQETNTKIDLVRKEYLDVSKEQIRYSRVTADQQLITKLTRTARKGLSNII